MTNKFEFWCPLGIIEKSTENIDPTATEQQMVLGGIASTIDADTDGEMLDPNGFDIAPLMKTGVVNWHHQAKGHCSAVKYPPVLLEQLSNFGFVRTRALSSVMSANRCRYIAGLRTNNCPSILLPHYF